MYTDHSYFVRNRMCRVSITNRTLVSSCKSGVCGVQEGIWIPPEPKISFSRFCVFPPIFTDLIRESNQLAILRERGPLLVALSHVIEMDMSCFFPSPSSGAVGLGSRK